MNRNLKNKKKCAYWKQVIIKINYKEIENLTKLRATLLPKLM